jgi:hypothetical protein
MGARRSCGQ